MQLVAILAFSAYYTRHVYKNIHCNLFNAPIYILLFNWQAQIWGYSGVKRTIVMNTVLIIQRLTSRIHRKKTISGVFNKIWRRKQDWVKKLTVLSITCKKIFLQLLKQSEKSSHLLWEELHVENAFCGSSLLMKTL